MTDIEKRSSLRRYFAKPEWLQRLIRWFSQLMINAISSLLNTAWFAGGVSQGPSTSDTGDPDPQDGTLTASTLPESSAKERIGEWLRRARLYFQEHVGYVPTDQQVDQWLADDIETLVPLTLEKSGVLREELTGEPLIIRGPVFWEVSGVAQKDLTYKKGKDGVARFSIYDVSIIFLTDDRLAAYRCDFNTLRNTALNESTTEYFYQDVVAVTTREISTPYVLPNKKPLASAQAFSVQIPSGDAITVIMSASRLEQVTDALMPATGAEQAVEVIRAMLRSKKGVVRMSQ